MERTLMPDVSLRSPHKLLARQTRRCLEPELGHGEAIPVAKVQALLDMVGDAYTQYERDFDLRTRSLDLSSKELGDALSKAEELSRLKSRFVANVSHEIRTPMNGLLGVLRVLQARRHEAEDLRYLAMMQQSADALMRIIDEILDFAKLEAGQMRIERRPFDPRSWVEQAVDLWRVQATDKGLTFDLHVEAQVPSTVNGDPFRLQQVLGNLVNNAIKFTDHGVVGVGLQWGRNRLGCAVSDTGVGIPEHQLSAIFQPFVQADVSTTRQYGGTGLGLTICADLVRLMGGEISADSRLGLGTTFRFEVPA